MSTYRLQWFALCAALTMATAQAGELLAPDLPPPTQIDRSLDDNLMMLNALNGLRIEQANQRKWNSGSHEFNLRGGAAQRHIINSGQRLKEWDVALERALRLPNKVSIDSDIGEASVARAEFAVGDAHHEAGRLLLRLWFAWEREQLQVMLWQQQVASYAQQAEMVDKRVKAGDAPRLELNLAQAAQSQAQVSQQQAGLRAQMAANELQRQFPAIVLPEQVATPQPQPINDSYAVWQQRILADNHELGMAQAQAQVQKLLAQRGRAEEIPDPTIGMRYSSEMGGNERVAGVFLSVPLSFGQRAANAQVAEHQANMATDQAEFVKRRLQTDALAVYQQAVRSYTTWQQAHEASQAINANAEMMVKAYRLGESSLSESLSANRLAQDSTLSENLALLDANEARYRLELDAHLMWAHKEEADK